MFEIFQPKILLFMKQSRPNNNSNSSSHQYGSKMELWRKTTWGNSQNKIKTGTYKSHNLQPLASESLDLEYFPTHAVDLVIVDEANQYSARTKKKISFVVFKTLKLLFLFSKGK